MLLVWLELQYVDGQVVSDFAGVGLVGDFVDDVEEEVAVGVRVLEQSESAFINVDGEKFAFDFDLAGADDLVFGLDGCKDGF